jgi:hypothetical protein
MNLFLAIENFFNTNTEWMKFFQKIDNYFNINKEWMDQFQKKLRCSIIKNKLNSLLEKNHMMFTNSIKLTKKQLNKFGNSQLNMDNLIRKTRNKNF